MVAAIAAGPGHHHPGVHTTGRNGAGPMRVILVDDHQLVRAGLRALLQSFRDVDVLAECGDGHEALALVDRMQPDVLLLDVTLPGLNGLEVALRVPRVSPKTRVLILSMHAGAE